MIFSLSGNTVRRHLQAEVESTAWSLPPLSMERNQKGRKNHDRTVVKNSRKGTKAANILYILYIWYIILYYYIFTILFIVLLLKHSLDLNNSEHLLISLHKLNMFRHFIKLPCHNKSPIKIEKKSFSLCLIEISSFDRETYALKL